MPSLEAFPQNIHISHTQPTSSVEGTSNILPYFIATAVLLPLLLQHLYRDYKAFIALGPGGTEQSVRGYLKLKALSIFALRDRCAPPPPQSNLVTKTGYLSSLPQRIGRRPRTEGIAPHRQVQQRSDTDIYDKLTAAIETCAMHCVGLEVGTSCFELNSTGLFCTNPERRTCGGEICHSHPSDGSMHMTLHPADVKTVLEAGWGERHPLARGGWMERFVPMGFVLIYAPRKVEEIDTLMEIVKAARWWVAGTEIDVQRDSLADGMRELKDDK